MYSSHRCFVLFFGLNEHLTHAYRNWRLARRKVSYACIVLVMTVTCMCATSTCTCTVPMSQWDGRVHLQLNETNAVCLENLGRTLGMMKKYIILHRK